MAKKDEKTFDAEHFVEKYNKNVKSMPFDYLFAQEFLKELYFLFKVSNRSLVWRRIMAEFHNFLKDDKITGPYDFAKACSNLRLGDMFSDEELRTFFFLSIPNPNAVPIDEAETEE